MNASLDEKRKPRYNRGRRNGTTDGCGVKRRERVAAKETIEYRFQSRLLSARQVQDRFILIAATDGKRVRKCGEGGLNASLDAKRKPRYNRGRRNGTTTDAE